MAGGLDPNSGTYRYQDFNNGSICLVDEDGKVMNDGDADADSTRKIVFGSNGGGVTSKGETWSGVATTLQNVGTNLTTALDIIQSHWKGDAADAAHAHLSKLRDTATSLSGTSDRMGSGLQMMGHAISNTQANYPDINDDNAGAAWTSLKSGTNDGLGRLPTVVEGDIPNQSSDTYRGTGPGPGPGPSFGGPGPGPGPNVGPNLGPNVDGPNIDGPNVDGPNVDGPNVDGPNIDGPNIDGPTYGPTYGPSTTGPSYGPSGPSYGPGYTGGGGLGDGGSATTLAGYDGGGAGGFGPGGAGLAGGGAGGLTGAGSGSGLGGLGGGLAGSGSAGAGGNLGVAGGPNVGGVGSVAPGMAGGAGRGGTMAPMMGRPGGGGSGDDSERERSTWLSEDDDLWGTSDAPPSVIS